MTCISFNSELKVVTFDDNMHHVATFSGHCESKQLSKTFELKDNVRIQQT